MVRVGASCFAVAVAVGLAGCNQGSARLAGRWHGARAEGVTPDTQASANAFATRMQIDVTGDVIVVTTGSDKQTCHYKTIREEKDKLVIATDKDGPKDEESFTFVDAKTMRWVVSPDAKAIVFVKEDDAKK
jgi:hypothetical protein